MKTVSTLPAKGVGLWFLTNFGVLPNYRRVTCVCISTCRKAVSLFNSY